MGSRPFKLHWQKFDANATAAAKRAGYSARNADKIGPELLGKTRVAAAIDALKAQRSETTGIDATFVLLQLIEIVKADVSDIISDDGEFKPISEWPAPWPQMCSTVTANTNGQLATKTWAAIQHWTKLCITAHWFEMTSERMWRTGKKESWFCTPQSCREENSEAFAGQHALTSTSFYIFDEGSAVPDSIYEVAEGGLTDGEPMIFIFGNPTRNTGKLYRTVFGSERNRWVHRVIDARKSKFPNKAQIAEWIEDHGEDSDFVRVRVRGLPPQASDLQFIDSERVFGAQQREPSLLGDEPLIAGVDIARGGADNNVIRFRRGQDARSIKPIRIPGEETRDSTVMVAKLADLLAETFDGRKIHTMFVDGTGIGDGAYDGASTRDLLRERYGETLDVVIPPPKNAVIRPQSARDPTVRDRHITQIRRNGRMAWQAATGYNRGSRIETQIGRWKSVIGPKLKSRGFSRQITEIQLGQKVLNTMTALGRPVFERIA